MPVERHWTLVQYFYISFLKKELNNKNKTINSNNKYTQVQIYLGFKANATIYSVTAPAEDAALPIADNIRHKISYIVKLINKKLIITCLIEHNKSKEKYGRVAT